MKRVHNPDPVPLRRREYQKMDGELMHALVEQIEHLAKSKKIKPTPLMAEQLQLRAAIKDRFPKR